MDTDAFSADATIELRRAGFWRRWLAIVIDTIIVMIPFLILAAILFAATAGKVQMGGGFSSCVTGTNIPQGLNPPPPHDSNSMRVCQFSFFGAPTGAILTVARVTQEGNTTTSVSQGYMLDKDGTPTNGTSIDGIYQLTLLVYLLLMTWKTGATLGARVVKIRVIDTANPGAPGVPLGKAIVRYLAMLIGAVPALALLIYQVAIVGGSADEIFTGNFFRWFAIAGLLWALWLLALIIQIARKRDPWYDRLAGTAVVRR